MLGLVPSTVHRVLIRFGLARLTYLDRTIGRVVRRYERGRSGEPVYVDIKKLGNPQLLLVGVAPPRRPRGTALPSLCIAISSASREREQGSHAHSSIRSV